MGHHHNIAREAARIAAAAFFAVGCLITPPVPLWAATGVYSTTADHASERITVTCYGPRFEGRTMGCGGTFWMADTSVLAVPLTRNSSVPCGTPFVIVGPCGTDDCTIYVRRTDTCRGCASNHMDLSDSGLATVCHGVSTDICTATMTRVHPSED